MKHEDNFIWYARQDVFLIGFVVSRYVVSIVSGILCCASMACWVSSLFANQMRVSASSICTDIFLIPPMLLTQETITTTYILCGGCAGGYVYASTSDVSFLSHDDVKEGQNNVYVGR